jgi:ABC-type oligopeptide transport system substrate-binding subunit
MKPHTALLQAQLQDNLRVQIQSEVVPWREYQERWVSDRPHLRWYGWIADYPDPDNFLRVAVGLHSGWRDDTYDELVERARRLTDQAERMRLYQRADRILMEEAAIIPISYERLPLLVKPWVRRFPTSATGSRFWKDIVIEPHQGEGRRRMTDEGPMTNDER